MKLIFHQEQNFGDALNPLIFNHYLKNFFDDDPISLFLGIGSILGHKRPEKNTSVVHVFSSGFGGGDAQWYGTLPSGNDLRKYLFHCVRGPYTAKALQLPASKAVCDGAILLPEVLKFSNIQKKYKYSYIPHLHSLNYYSSWKTLLQSLDIHLIDPREEVEKVVKEINQSELIITEAMHGAIVADTYRIPWIPVKSNKLINSFKWEDYCSSLNLAYFPHYLNTLFDFDFLRMIANNKTFGISNKLSSALASSYSFYQKRVVEKKVCKVFNMLKNTRNFLSEENILMEKKEILINTLKYIHKEYKQSNG